MQDNAADLFTKRNNNNNSSNNNRNRSNNKRNPRDRWEKSNSFKSENGENPGITFSSTTSGSSELANECVKIEAVNFLKDRWDAIVRALNEPNMNPKDRPTIFSVSEGASVWGSSKQVHQASPVMNFSGEMSQSIRKANNEDNPPIVPFRAVRRPR